MPLACDLHPEFGSVGSAPRLLRKLGRLKNSHAHSISIDQRRSFSSFSRFSHSLGQNPNLSSTFEPSTGLRRQIVGEPFPRRLSRKVGWQKRAPCTDTAE